MTSADAVRTVGGRPAEEDQPEPHLGQSPHMSAAAFRFVSFVVLAIVAGALWVDLFRSTGETVTATPVIPSFSSKSIFAPATRPASGLAAGDVVQNGTCNGCSVHVGSGGLVRAEVPAGAGKRTAYALLDLGNRAAHGPVLVHDVIGFGRGEAPAKRVRLLQVLDSSHRVIFELVAAPDRRLYLTSPAGGLRASPLVRGTGAIVPNDGISGVAVDVAVKTNDWVLISVNGLQTEAVHGLAGGRTGVPRFLAAGVIGYKAPPHAAAITATHAQVSVTTPSAPARAAQPAAHVTPPVPPAKAATTLSSVSPPTISGSGVVGGTLTAAPGSWSDSSATFTYAWERCDGDGSCGAIDGAEGKTYDLVPADRDAFVRVRVTAHVADASVSRASASVGPVSPAAPTALTEPSISGDAVVGVQLTADPGSWSDPDASFTFVWQRCDDAGICTTIDGEVGAAYIVSADDLGSFLLVEVTASNGGGANLADSVPTDVVVPAAPTVVTAPSISGDATVGSTLTADPGTWSDPAPTFTYAWLRCHGNSGCSTIDGADGTTYLLTRDDVGFRIEVAVTATDAGGASTVDSSPIGPVVPHGPPVVVTAPSVGGEVTVGSILTADPGTWSDPAATFSDAWLRCDGSGACTAIDGAVGTTYVLTADDVGYSVGVEVTASGATGTGVSGSNLVGPVVLQAPPVVVTAPSISGDATVGSILTADPGTWSDPTATFTYAWLRCGGSGPCTAINGADGSTYTLTDDDLGSSIRVEVTASNAGGTATAESTSTDPVGPTHSSARR
jgi:hypothetical protein